MKSSLLVLTVSVLLASCGGGGSSSEPSGVTYNGAQTGILVAGGFSESLGSLPFRMVVGADNSVFITDTASGDQEVVARGSLSGDRFSAVSNSTVTEEGVTCTFNWTYNGRIEGNAASGSIAGTTPCSDGTFPVTFTLRNGSFSATTGNSKALNSSSGILKATVQVIR